METSRMGAAGRQRKEAAANEMDWPNEMGRGKGRGQRMAGGSGVISRAGASVSARAGVPHR